MIDLELFRQAANNIKSLGLRSNLTIIGIVIGIAAIVTLISLGSSLNESVSSQFQVLGTNTVIVLPGKSFAASAFSKLQENDVKKIEGIKGVDFASEAYLLSKTVGFKEQKKTSLIVGIDAGKIDKLSFIKIIEVDEGSLIHGTGFSALAGPSFSKKAFSKPVEIGQKISLGSKSFKVAGIIKKSSNFYSTVFSDAVIVDKDALKQSFDEKFLPSRIYVSLAEGADSSVVKEKITSVLKKAHGEEDFQVIDAGQIASIASSVIGTIQLFLVAIAAISLIVGGIGVMNAMFMNVVERTKEIGVMKSVGATNNQIMSIFLTEASLIGLIGGFLGVALGFAMAFGISIVTELIGFPLPFIPDAGLAFFGIFFAVTVSVASGFLPAISAAKLDPIEALRFEN